MTRLPALPTRSAPVRFADLERVEQRVTAQLSKITNIDELREWQAQAAALAVYLDDKVLRGPMLGAQRRVEARIGQLLGDAERTGPRTKTEPIYTRAYQLIERPGDRRDFRILAAGLNGQVKLSEDDWRASRRSLVSRIREQLPTTPKTKAKAKAKAKAKPAAHRIEDAVFSEGTETICPTCGGSGRVPITHVGGRTR